MFGLCFMRSNLFLWFLLLGWGYLTQQICEAKSPQEASTQACMSNYVLSIAPKDIAIVGNLFKKPLLEFLPRMTFGPSMRAYVYTTKSHFKKYIPTGSEGYQHEEFQL